MNTKGAFGKAESGVLGEKTKQKAALPSYGRANRLGDSRILKPQSKSVVQKGGLLSGDQTSWKI